MSAEQRDEPRAEWRGLPCGFEYPTYRCNMPESVHQGEHPFQPHDRRTRERRLAAPAGLDVAAKQAAAALELVVSEPWWCGWGQGQSRALDAARAAKARLAARLPADTEGRRDG